MIIERLSDFFSRHSTGLLLGMCLLLVLYILFRKPKTIVENDPLVLQELASFKDENGKLHQIIEQQEIDKAGMGSYIDSLAKVLKIKPRFIKGQDRFTLVVDTIFKDLPVERIIHKDTAYRIEKHDRWLDAVAVAGKDTGSIQFTLRDTLERMEIVKNPLIGRTQRQIFISASSPYNKILMGTSFTLKEKQTWLSIGPSVQYDPFGRRFAVGLSAQIPIIKLKR